jgi:hypothetical protein
MPARPSTGFERASEYVGDRRYFGVMQDSTFGLDHPLVRCAEELGAALDRVDDVDPMYMPTPAKAAALVELARISSRVQVLLGRVLAGADDVALDDGARSAAAWLAHRTRTSYGPAAAAVGLGEALDGRWQQLGAAVSAGQVNVEQARVIVRALDELPSDLDPELALKAEAHLVAEAAFFDPKRLRILGRKVLEVVAPEVFEDQERRRLEDEERRARETTSLTMRTRGDGTTDIRARVSDAVAARLKTYLEAFTAPRRGHLDQGPDHIDPDTGRRVPHAVRLGHAFGALLEALPAQVLPRHGGSATTLVVTLDYDRLRARLGSAELSTGDVISASEAMRLACTADLVPVVLNGDGVPLHLGRARRLFDEAQRRAMGIRDGHCRAHGCDLPAAWCEAHHKTDWCRGGKTDIADGVLLCPWHHHRAHDPAFDTEYLLSGDVRFRRRT